MKILTYDCIVVGTGAAGYNAACRLKQAGKRVAIVTEGVNCGTSRNTGSDKQTYYKLGLAGDHPDSVRRMTEDLMAGGSVDGDNALCEAALSVRCFMNLCELGVAFPANRYGEFVGYKTDHDPCARATSAGPLTSKYMTEALQRRAGELGVEVFDGCLAIEILKHEGAVCGLLALNLADGGLVAFRCGDVVLCTGGPAGVYADSVYPVGHTGTTSLALLAGAKAQNLTEWQYGLASVAPRWNVSGTYMQVLPRFVSVDGDGTEREFLAEFFADPYEALSAVFLKGYQWPFDSKKVLEGSSVIDLLVYRERVLRNRRVYLDYRKNPFGMTEIDYERLSPEAYEYLRRADALFGTPIERLEKMNAPAIELYRGKGLDLGTEMLEIALCAQHNNGGIAVDHWWQTSVKGLFAAGECAGTHGVTRPGGSALNAGQVGSLRAAQYIAARGSAPVGEDVFAGVLSEAENRHFARFGKMSAGILPENGSAGTDFGAAVRRAQRRMSDCAAAIRSADRMRQALAETEAELAALETAVFADGVSVRGTSSAPETTDVPCACGAQKFCTCGAASGSEKAARMLGSYKLRDVLVTQSAMMTAMIDYADTVGATRGSSLCYDKNGALRPGLDEMFRFTCEDGSSRSRVQETFLSGDGFRSEWRAVRPVPETDDFFENVWRGYRENGNID